MNEMNGIETRLRSWRPRRPSAGLKERIFDVPLVNPHRTAWLLGWLAPATACAMVVLSVVNSGSGISGSISRDNPMVAVMMSNQDYAAYASRSGENNPSAATFDWTNRSGSPSTMRFAPAVKTTD